MLKSLITVCAVMVLAGCATSTKSGYSDRIAQINADCQARGGSLAPSIGVGRRASPLNYQCDMPGGGGRLSAR